MEERTGEAYELGEQLTVLGRKLQVGEMAPEFVLEHYDGLAMETVRLSESGGKVRLLSLVPSMDTPVCHLETRHWEELRADSPPGTVLYTISMDLPYAQSRWQAAEGITHRLLSAHRSERFGQEYGVLIKEWRLLQRSVFVIDRAGKIVYVEYIDDQMRQPDYEAALEAVRQASGAGA